MDEPFQEESPSEEEKDEFNFDTSLPSSHPYLSNMWGEGIKVDYSYEPWFEIGSILEIPIWKGKDVILPYEQTHLSGEGEELEYLESLGMFSRDGNVKSKVLGAVFFKQEMLQGEIAEVGVTVRIECNYWSAPQQQSSIPRFSLFVQGRQRFRILRVIHKPTEIPLFQRLIWGVVEILSDGPSAPPRPLMNYSLKDVTPLPYWLYEKYSPISSLEKLKVLSAMILPIEKIPDDPYKASFWIARNLVLSSADRLELLTMSTPERLLKEIDILQKYTSICCRQCNAIIASTKDIFSLSDDGPQSAFINEYGYVHSTITLRKIVQLPLLYGNPTTENSWFPGYAWSIALCSNCANHVGWKFVKTQSHLSPSSFWGLSRLSLRRTIES